MKRRALLKALPAVAVLPAVAAVPVFANPSPLGMLIEAHRAAYLQYKRSWEAYCQASDAKSPLVDDIGHATEQHYEFAEAEWQRIIKYRPQSVDECMMIASYAVEHQGRADASESWCYRELLESWKAQVAA